LSRKADSCFFLGSEQIVEPAGCEFFFPDIERYN
jgi:hypothetical protein